MAPPMDTYVEVASTIDSGPATARGVGEWPEIALTDKAWSEYTARAAAVTEPSELFIALAIESSVAGATAAFERRYFPALDAALHTAGATPTELDDVHQILRVHLFTVAGPGERARVIAYAGRGRLASLLRVAAIRALADVRGPAASASTDPALASLAPSARVALRMHAEDNVGVDAIAAILGVHRATASMRIERARLAVASDSPHAGRRRIEPSDRAGRDTDPGAARARVTATVSCR